MERNCKDMHCNRARLPVYFPEALNLLGFQPDFETNGPQAQDCRRWAGHSGLPPSTCAVIIQMGG